MIETFLLIYAISVIYALVERENGKELFATFQEAFVLTSSFLMVVHILSSPNTAYLITNLSPVVILVYGLVKKIRAGLKQKTEEKRIEASRKQGGTTCPILDPNSPNTCPILKQELIDEIKEHRGV